MRPRAKFWQRPVPAPGPFRANKKGKIWHGSREIASEILEASQRHLLGLFSKAAILGTKFSFRILAREDGPPIYIEVLPTYPPPYLLAYLLPTSKHAKLI